MGTDSMPQTRTAGKPELYLFMPLVVHCGRAGVAVSAASAGWSGMTLPISSWKDTALPVVLNFGKAGRIHLSMERPDVPKVFRQARSNFQ